MTPATTLGDNTAAIGFLLTLVSLLGGFFAIHLSNWLRDILEVRAKFDANRVGDSQERRSARAECSFTLRRLINHVTLLVTVVLASFIAYVLTLARGLLSGSGVTGPVTDAYSRGLVAFAIVYGVLTAYFLIAGYVNGGALRADITRAKQAPGKND
jgi:hypothetical protein